MTWQDDELRRLDEERAAGRLSADDYQRRRTEIIDQSGTESGSSGGQTGAPSPFPPAFRWESTPPSESTHLIKPVGDQDAESEQTQVVQTPPPPPPPGPSYEDSERTQVVQAGPPPSPYGPATYPSGYPQQPAWSTQQSAPPWADVPPIQEPNTGWMLQGPESFEAQPKDSSTMRILGIAAAVLVVLGIGIGAFFLFRPDGGGTAAPGGDTETPQPATTIPLQPSGPPIASLPGRLTDTSQVRNFEQIQAAQYLTEEELQALSDAQANEAALAISNEDGNRLIILVVEVQRPVAVREQLGDLQLQFNLSELAGAAAGIRAAGDNMVPDGDPVLRRAHYASGEYLVRVQASGINPIDVDSLFLDILADQLDKLPADE